VVTSFADGEWQQVLAAQGCRQWQRAWRVAAPWL